MEKFKNVMLTSLFLAGIFFAWSIILSLAILWLAILFISGTVGFVSDLFRKETN